MNTAVSFQGVDYVFFLEQEEDVAALNGVNLDLQTGDFISIIGPNGSGKSSLARHMNALLQPTRGTVLVSGKDTKDDQSIWPIRRQAGMVFQNPDNQLVATTVEEDIAFGMENLGVPYDDMHRRLDQALRQVGMEAYRHHEPHRLSGGQKQRVAIASVLAMKPSVIVFDEATSMLDPQGRKEMMGIVHQLAAREEWTLIQVTHFLEETLESDQIVVLDQGRVKMMGRPSDIFDRERELQAIGLDVPIPVQLQKRLQEKGVRLPDRIGTEKDGMKRLCEWL